MDKTPLTYEESNTFKILYNWCVDAVNESKNMYNQISRLFGCETKMHNLFDEKAKLIEETQTIRSGRKSLLVMLRINSIPEEIKILEDKTNKCTDDIQALGEIINYGAWNLKQEMVRFTVEIRAGYEEAMRVSKSLVENKMAVSMQKIKDLLS